MGSWLSSQGIAMIFAVKEIYNRETFTFRFPETLAEFAQTFPQVHEKVFGNGAAAGISMPELPLQAARVPCRSTSKALTNKGAGAESSLINKLVTAMGLPCLGNGNHKGSEPLLKILGGKSAKGIASPAQAQLGDIPSSAASDSGK